MQEIIRDIADALVSIDSSRIPYHNYKPGVGPYSEPTLIKKVRDILNENKKYFNLVQTKRTPDLLIKGFWALEFKIVRPFGDNGKEAENWSVNLIHPYPGNISSLGDCVKLGRANLPERKGIIVIGYEHNPPKIPIEPLIKSFELISEKVMNIQLNQLIIENRKNLVHPVHQQLTVYGWELLGLKFIAH